MMAQCLARADESRLPLALRPCKENTIDVEAYRARRNHEDETLRGAVFSDRRTRPGELTPYGVTL
jgi:hypothetical protein